MTLTALEIKNAKPGMHADGGGLYLHVGKAGNASWIFRFQLNKRRREMGLGALLSLAPVEARAKAAELKAMVGRGIDPLELKQAVREEETKAVSAQREEEALNVATFKLATEKHLALKESGWRNAKHRQQWENTLTTYAYPVIGDLPVRDITTRHVLQVLEPIWSTKPETASRVRMRIEAVLNSAKVLGWRTGENPAFWRGNLDAALPPRGKVRRVKHHPALPWRNISAFIHKLKDRDGISARALEFLVLTAARSGEVRMARWSEIDLDQKLWVVPADRMEAGREHRVPLSDATVRLLSDMPRFQGYDLIFPGTRMQPLSDMSLSAVLKRMGIRAFITRSIPEQVHLVAIGQNGAIQGCYFGTNYEAAVAWAAEQNQRGENIYFSLHLVRAELHKQPQKMDVTAPRLISVDIDPPKSGGPFDKEGVLRRLASDNKRAQHTIGDCLSASS